MKIHSFKTEITLFSFIFLFYLLPPCFIINSDNFITKKTSTIEIISLIINFLLAGFIYLIYKEKSKDKTTETKTILLKDRIIYLVKTVLIPFLFCLFFLLSISLLIKSIANYFSNELSLIKTLDGGFVYWLIIILSFILSSFYEEIIYRFYCPDILFNLITQKQVSLNDKKVLIIKIICESVTAILFALAHFYMGLFSVINALFAHIILRFVYKKTNNIYITTTAHCIYNIISLILL